MKKSSPGRCYAFFILFVVISLILMWLMVLIGC